MNDFPAVEGLTTSLRKYPEHGISYLMALNHFDEIMTVRNGEPYRTFISSGDGKRRHFFPEEMRFAAVGESFQEAATLIRAHMVENSQKYNHVFYRKADLRFGKATPDINDHRIYMQITFSVARVPYETVNRGNGSFTVREDKFHADMAAMGISVREMPKGPRGRGCTLRYSHTTGDKYSVKHQTIFSDVCEDSIVAYRNILDKIAVVMEGCDATWAPAGVFVWPTSKENSTGGLMYKATVTLMPFSTKDTTDYDFERFGY